MIESVTHLDCLVSIMKTYGTNRVSILLPI